MRADPTCEPHLSPTRLGSWSDPAKPWTCFQQSACRVKNWAQSARELLLSPTIKEPIKCPAKALSVSFLKVQKSHSPAKVGYRQGLLLGSGGLRNRTPHACGSSPSPNTSSGQPDRPVPPLRHQSFKTHTTCGVKKMAPACVASEPLVSPLTLGNEKLRSEGSKV
jgi:hypothetical protein